MNADALAALLEAPGDTIGKHDLVSLLSDLRAFADEANGLEGLARGRWGADA